MTGYTLLAFMAAGNLPEEGPYAAQVEAGMRYLLDSVQPDGLFTNIGGHYMYNHGIATIALAELYGETRDELIRPKLEALIGIILSSQSDEGGWRYSPSPRDADISVTVMQLVALRASLNSGLAVPSDVIDRALDYVRSCYVPSEGAFGYQPGRDPGVSRTSAAIYALQVCGAYDDPLVPAGSKYILQNYDQNDWWTYGLFYAAPAHLMIGGLVWENWYSLVEKILLKRVKFEGDVAFWPTEKQNQDLGPVFTTAVYTHVLSMPMHLVPLYQR